MSTASITVPAPHALTGREEELDRYQAVQQYSVAKILGVWAAATIPMGVLAWIVAPTLEDKVPVPNAYEFCNVGSWHPATHI